MEAFNKKQILTATEELGIRTHTGRKWVVSSFEYWNKKGAFPDPMFLKAKVATIYDKDSAIMIVKKLADLGGKGIPTREEIIKALTTA